MGEVNDSWESDSLTAWAGDRPVGHVAGFRFDTLVPGGALATNGVTRAGVLFRPTPPRRRQPVAHPAAHRGTRAGAGARQPARQRPLIYGRYGFGLAGVNPGRGRRPRAADRRRDDTARCDSWPPTRSSTPSPRSTCGAPRAGVLRRPLAHRPLRRAATEAGGDAEFAGAHVSRRRRRLAAHYGVKWDDAPFTNAVGKGALRGLGDHPGVELALWDYCATSTRHRMVL